MSQDQSKRFALPEKFKPKLFAMIIVCVAAAVILAVAISVGLLGLNRRPSYTLFVKDNALYYSNFRQEYPFRISTRLLNDPNETAGSVYAENLHRYITLSNSTLFFPENAEMNDGGDFVNFDLFFQRVTDDNGSKTKVDTNVSEYYVNSDAMTVTYLKPKSGGLYQYQLKPDDRDLIADQVDRFWVNESGRKILYLTRGRDLYLYTVGEGKEKIDSGVDEVSYVADELAVGVYFKEDSIYLHRDGQNKKKLDTRVTSLVSAYEDGTLYYTKGSYIPAQEDTEAQYPQLYYYDKEESHLITPQLQEVTVVNADTPAAVILTGEEGGYAAVCKATSLPLPDKDAQNFLLTPDAKKVYWFSQVTEDGYGTLNCAKLSDDQLGQTEEFDTQVYVDHCFITANSEVVYFKQMRQAPNLSGELYLDQEKLDTDVNPLHLFCSSDLSQIFYYTDWDYTDLCGTLKVAKDNSAVKVSDFASHACLLPNGELVYMYDFSLQRNLGEIYVYRGGSTEKIHEDVSYIIALS